MQNLVDADFDLSWVGTSERFKFKRSMMATINPTERRMIEEFHEQEAIRIGMPLHPFEYKLNGKSIMVGPMVRTRKQLQSVPRHYPLLKNDRPPQITFHSVTRDAAARLPDFVGTRSDVAILVRDSQYVVDNISETMLISAVSGSLDRLSAEKDPPVRYDNTYKVWVYLHGHRQINSDKWGD
jgi:nuclear factor related to kappa-B-binding protein